MTDFARIFLELELRQARRVVADLEKQLREMDAPVEPRKKRKPRADIQADVRRRLLKSGAPIED